jgi:hypothetical protein
MTIGMVGVAALAAVTCWSVDAMTNSSLSRTMSWASLWSEAGLLSPQRSCSTTMFSPFLPRLDQHLGLGLHHANPAHSGRLRLGRELSSTERSRSREKCPPVHHSVP